MRRNLASARRARPRGGRICGGPCVAEQRGVVRSGSFFQARLAPLLARLVPPAAVRAGAAGISDRNRDCPIGTACAESPHTCPHIQHRRRPRRPRRGLRGMVLPALPPRRGRAHRADAREVLRRQPGRREPVQPHPEGGALGPQALLRVCRAAERPQPAHRGLRPALLPAGAARIQAAPGLQRPRLPEPGLFPAGPRALGADRRALRHLLRGILGRMGLFAQLDRADRGPVRFAHADGQRLRGQEGHARGEGAGPRAT